MLARKMCPFMNCLGIVCVSHEYQDAQIRKWPAWGIDMSVVESCGGGFLMSPLNIYQDTRAS